MYQHRTLVPSRCLLRTCGRNGHHKGSHIVGVGDVAAGIAFGLQQMKSLASQIRIAPLHRTYDFGLVLAPDERKSDIEWVWLSSLVRGEHLASTLAFRDGR